MNRRDAPPPPNMAWHADQRERLRVMVPFLWVDPAPGQIAEFVAGRMLRRFQAMRPEDV